LAYYKESYDVILNNQGKPQSERLELLNELVICKLEAIQQISMDTIKKLEDK
jgi:hypothetical protein